MSTSEFLIAALVAAIAVVVASIIGAHAGRAQAIGEFMAEAIKKGHAVYRLNEADGTSTWEWLPPCKK